MLSLDPWGMALSSGGRWAGGCGWGGDAGLATGACAWPFFDSGSRRSSSLCSPLQPRDGADVAAGRAGPAPPGPLAGAARSARLPALCATDLHWPRKPAPATRNVVQPVPVRARAFDAAAAGAGAGRPGGRPAWTGRACCRRLCWRCSTARAAWGRRCAGGSAAGRRGSRCVWARCARERAGFALFYSAPPVCCCWVSSGDAGPFSKELGGEHS